MKTISSILLIVLTLVSCKQNVEIKYLDNYSEEGGSQIFAENLISTSGIEFSPSFSKDGLNFYYVKSDSIYSKYQIVEARYKQGDFKRKNIEVPNHNRPFSPFPFQDKLYFASLDSSFNSKIYYLMNDKIVELDSNINAGKFNGYLSISKSGTICFESNREGGEGKGDIYLAYLQSDGSYDVINAGEGINTPGNESDAFIAEDESFIIFTAYDREDSFGSADLYISFNDGNGKFGKGINLGAEINSVGLEHNPHISPDKKYLFYSSNKINEGVNGPGNGNFDIYWVDIKVIQNIGLEAGYTLNLNN